MTDIDILLGLSIAARRERMELSRADLAQTTGLSEHAIQSFEEGKRRATARQLFDIADALSVPVRTLFPSIAEERASTCAQSEPPIPGFDDARNVAAHYHALSGPYRATSFAFLVALQVNRDPAYKQ